MDKYFNNEKGMTLIELLATISIAAMIIIMITSTYLFIQHRYQKQVESTNQLNDITYVLKRMTHDFRRTEPQRVICMDEHSIIIEDNHYQWNEEKKQIELNESVIMNQIDYFSVIEEQEVVHISIKHADKKVKNLSLARREGGK